jgi:hypothetical protein
MEVQQSDGIECAWRCYEAIASADNVLTGQALWRAFGRYWRRVAGSAAYGCNRARPRATLRGSSVGEHAECVEG